MKITVYGAGYVGLVTAVCFAEFGNHVVCMDTNQQRIDILNQGICPIHEPYLPKMLKENWQAGRLMFISDPQQAVEHGFYQFITVGTPSKDDGSADLQYVLAAAKNIGKYLTEERLVIIKSTVPVLTKQKVQTVIEEELQKRSLSVTFNLAANPEFLRQGNAVEDFIHSDRIIIGADNPQAIHHLKQLYRPFDPHQKRIIEMGHVSAELAKYAANAILATKISFINEISNIAERLPGADIEAIRQCIGSDSRVGFSFISPGCGYGGSCFPKDIRALEKMAQALGYHPALIAAVDKVNNYQKNRLIEKIAYHYGHDLKNKTFALWGLSFKPSTDDMREASSRVLIDQLLKAECSVQAFDPAACGEAQKLYQHQPGFSCASTPEEALKNADALIVVTEWRQFASPDFVFIKKTLKSPVIFDGRNLYDPGYLKKAGFDYYAIGRGKSTFYE